MKDVILAYPYYSKELEVYGDGSKTQLGAFITQSDRLIAFFSQELTEAQQNYSMTEIELLAVVETLKGFKGMIWGERYGVYTDHENLTRDA